MADCTLCGGRWINGYMGCSRPNCNEYRLVTECNEWPVQLGLSIRRFVRRAEVEGLRETTGAALGVSDDVPFERYMDAVDALDRLAALAMEES